jgi:hypothetical protein
MPKKPKVHNFIIHGGPKVNPERPGKLVWPDHLHLVLPRFYAEDLARKLLDWLLDESKREEKEYTYTTVGSLKSDISGE